MNTFVLTCLLCLVLFSVLATRASEASSSGELSSGTVGSASGEVLRVLQGNADGDDEELAAIDDKKKRKGKGKKKNKQKSRSTTALNPEHSFSTQGRTSAMETSEDPCNSTHLDYCIHGYCQRMEGLQEPVCICTKGYDGERCGIQTLGILRTKSERSGDMERLQMALVVTAVVLSLISCAAVLLMACAHYRWHKNFLASYLGSWSEQQKLHRAASDVVV
ncbi:amphiregulin isoform X1 [Syngnathus scovelli]|uniref:amphiregulin isoform X1 n=1 Tax=Syngnathus scovelli TaxID=161590 RepID=UPI00210FE7DA|nr:amphiregulin isoform X1 [Syngnathus scovelli]XP_049618739.1 amphiregulin isoform X1 [Syngnathus scovelli]